MSKKYWQNIFWKDKTTSEYLNEILDNKSVDLLKMKDTLNQDLWEEDMTLKPEIRKRLLEISRMFIDSVESNDISFSDIVLVGSMANYNYTEDSDIDVHIIVEFEKISPDSEFVSEFFKLKKDLWGIKHPIQIKGHDVELYFQDINENLKSTGMYSLLHGNWVKKPVNKIIDINTSLVEAKSSDLMNMIDKIINTNDTLEFLKKYREFMLKLKKYRKSGLDDVGEYSTENLVFKILRNSGYISKLKKEKNNRITNSLSIKESY